MHCLFVTLVAREGKEQELVELFEELGPASRAEPGCRMYLLHRSPQDRRRFILYEQYDDPAALAAHRATPHYKELATGRLPELVESRSLEIFDAI